MSGKKVYTIDDAMYTLDRIMSQISNCDTKASILLGLAGVFITIVADKLLSIYFEPCHSLTSLLAFKYSLFFLVSSILICVGIVFALIVLFPRLNPPSSGNHIFFKSIASKYTSITYKESITQLDRNCYFNELIEQIYINAQICKSKYTNFKWATILAGSGLVIFSITAFALVIS